MTKPSTKKWQKVKTFNTYEDAATYKAELKKDPDNFNLEIKIKRCGSGGMQFNIKTWRPPTQAKK